MKLQHLINSSILKKQIRIAVIWVIPTWRYPTFSRFCRINTPVLICTCNMPPHRVMICSSANFQLQNLNSKGKKIGFSDKRGEKKKWSRFYIKGCPKKDLVAQVHNINPGHLCSILALGPSNTQSPILLIFVNVRI